MPSGKPRRHKGNTGGRPANKDLYKRIDNLQTLLAHKNRNDATWKLINRLLTVMAELDDLATPLQAAVYNTGGHGTDTPLVAGVRLADDGAGLEHPDGDGETNWRDRNLYHGGRQFQLLNAWLYRQIDWPITTVERRLENKEPDPKPGRAPRETPHIETVNQ